MKQNRPVEQIIYDKLVLRPPAEDEFGDYDRFADERQCLKIIKLALIDWLIDNKSVDEILKLRSNNER